MSSTRPTIYVARLLPQPVMAALRERFDVQVPETMQEPDREDLLRGLREAEGAICTLMERIDEDALARASRLRIVANYAVGFNNIDLEAARRHNVIITN